MIQVSLRSGSAYLLGLFGLALIACAASGTDKEPLNTAPADSGQSQGNNATGDDDDNLNAKQTGDNGAFGASSSSSGSSSSSSSSTGGTSSSSSGGSSTSSSGSSGGNTNYCAGTLAAGDLAITEVMISSKSGSGDTGEWIEVTNTRSCTLKVGGVTVTSPRGATTSDTATVDASLELAPNATFVVADVPNGALGAHVYAWNSSDVLKNDGDTVTVMLGSTTIDTLTYSAPSNTAGTSLEFPAGCNASLRSDLSNWVSSTTAFGSFFGTPNAPNTDVTCVQ